MSDSKPGSIATVTRLWTEATYGRESVLVSIVNGAATVRVYHFDIQIPGEFDPDDIEGVIAAHHKQLKRKVTFTTFPDDLEECEPVYVIDIPEEEEEKHEVIYLNDARQDE